VFQRAVSAGAMATVQAADMFWGDRYARLTDPFGHDRVIGTHKKDLSPTEIRAAGEKAMAEMWKKRN